MRARDAANRLRVEHLAERRGAARRCPWRSGAAFFAGRQLPGRYSNRGVSDPGRPPLEVVPGAVLGSLTPRLLSQEMADRFGGICTAHRTRHGTCHGRRHDTCLARAMRAYSVPSTRRVSTSAAATAGRVRIGSQCAGIGRSAGFLPHGNQVDNARRGALSRRRVAESM
jgi:hypothetical protein